MKVLRATTSFVVLLLAFVATSLGLNHTRSGSSQGTNPTVQREVADPSGSFGSQLAKESREAADEEKGENDELKKSPAVRFVAHLTGTSVQSAYWICMGLNFAVIAGFILWISRRHLPGVFRGRTEAIQRAMLEARKASEEANRRMAEIESRLAKLDSEISSMRAEADKEAIAEEGRILAAAEEERSKIVITAEQEIVAAAKAARRDLKAYAADLAVGLAKRQIRVDGATDRALIHNFADHLSQSNGSGKGDH
jgi:F-type H+-transporting ATPase subunit b